MADLDPLVGPDPSNPDLVAGPGANIRPLPFGVPRDIRPANILSESPNRPLFEDVLRRNGIDTNKPDPFAEMLKQVMPKTALQPIGMPSFEAFPSGTGGRIETSPSRLMDAFAAGFGESPMGTLTRFLQMREGARYENRPGYDIFRDPQIARAGLLNQLHLFYGSGSETNTRWLIERIRDKQATAEHYSRMDGGEVAMMAGGILGDPSTYLPLTLGTKVASLAVKARQGALTGSEMAAISQPTRIALGSIADGLIVSGVTGGFMVAQRALEHGVDPTMAIDEVTDSLFLPMAIAGSLGLLVSAFGRRSARTLAQQASRPDFLAATPASGARYVPDEFIGPVRHPTDEAAAALASPYDDAATRMRRMEHVDIGPDRAPGPRTAAPFNGLPNDGALSPGSLATDYGDMVKRQAATSPQTAAILGQQEAGTWRPVGAGEVFPPGQTFRMNQTTGLSEVFTPAPARAVGRIDHELPADASGSRELVLNGQSRSAAEFMVGHTFTTPGGQTWRVNNVEGTKRFELWDQKARPITSKQAIANLDNRGERDIIVGGKVVPANAHKDGDILIDDNGIEFRLEENKSGIATDIPKVWKVISTNEAPTVATRLEDMEFKPGELEAGSVGAALSPQSQVYQREVLLAQGRMAPTGIGLEKLPLDPVARQFMGLSVAAMRAVADLVSTGGRVTMGNRQGIANLPPVEAIIRANWDPVVVRAVRGLHDNWAAARAAVARGSGQLDPDELATFSGRTDIRRLAHEAGTALKDKITRGEPGLSFAEFRRRVAEGWNNGDADELTDAYTPYVNRSVADMRKATDLVKDKAVEQRIFEEAHQKAVYQAYSEVRAIKKEADELKRQNPTRSTAQEEALLVRLEDAEFKAKQLEKRLDDLKANGPTLNSGDASFRPRMWDAGKLIKEEQRAMDIFVSHLMSQAGGGHDVQEAARIAKQMHTTLSRQNPVYERGDAERLFMSVASPDSAMARTFSIPDKMVKEFLVDDAEVLLRYHVQQMGTAIEMKKRFGSLDMAEQISEIEQEYRQLLIDATARKVQVSDPEMLRTLREKAAAGQATLHEKALIGRLTDDELSDYSKQVTSMMKGAVRDVQALRDKLYGTYGAAVDPHAWTSRTIRMAKQFSNITLLGMSGVSALGDLVRPLMTEGLEATYGMGIRALMSDSRGTILRMAKDDLEMSGTGMDLMKNVRALQAHDTGDVFGSRGRIEHALSTGNQWMFIANGLNSVTEFTKQWASITIQGNMNKTLLDFGNGIPISEFNRTRLAVNAIDEPLARRIALQLKIHGKDFADVGNGQFVLANLTAWKDELAAEAYKSALFQQVERTIATPGIGDRSNWISTEMGSLIGQYKSWGMAMMTRSLYSGLQEGGNRFWYGAAGMVGFAILLNEVRSRLMYDKSTFDRPATAVIADGVDRSSILGWFSDANRAVETLTGNRLGVKPMLGASHVSPVDPVRVAGTLGGPATGQAFRAGSVMNDFLSGHPTARTYANWRTLWPGNTLPYLDPAYDHTISDGNYRRALERRRTQQPAG